MAETENDTITSGKDWLPSTKKIGAFVLAVFDLKRSVDTLKKQNEQLQSDVYRLQRQVDEQAGQLKTLQQFIQTSVYDHAARSGEQAAFSLVQQLLTSDRNQE
jgi:chaperonin cofactor prefoldin